MNKLNYQLHNADKYTVVQFQSLSVNKLFSKIATR